MTEDNRKANFISLQSTDWIMYYGLCYNKESTKVVPTSSRVLKSQKHIKNLEEEVCVSAELRKYRKLSISAKTQKISKWLDSRSRKRIGRKMNRDNEPKAEIIGSTKKGWKEKIKHPVGKYKCGWRCFLYGISLRRENDSTEDSIVWIKCQTIGNGCDGCQVALCSKSSIHIQNSVMINSDSKDDGPIIVRPTCRVSVAFKCKCFSKCNSVAQRS